MKKRISLFDNLKFLLMTTVVIGHLSDCLVKSSDIMKRHMFLFMPFICHCSYIYQDYFTVIEM